MPTIRDEMARGAWRIAVGLPLGVAIACGGTARGQASSPRANVPSLDAPSRDSAAVRGIRVGQATLHVHFEDDEPPIEASLLQTWIERSAAMVAEYCGGFPVPTLQITIVGGSGRGVGFGFHQDGRRLRIAVGRRTTEASLRRDWVMIHEMLHAAFPDLDRPHRWMQEGLSTYLEPIVRARAGELDDAAVWGKWVRMMEYGRPRLGDRGLDRTHTWGRTYWGGALFWLMVDLELRSRTDNRVGLRDAVRGILAAGGNGRVDWSTADVVRVADEATGTTVLRDLYRELAQAPGDVDLDALWDRLGVVRGPGGVTFDDGAPLASIRRAMTRG